MAHRSIPHLATGSGMEQALYPVVVISGLFGVAPITHGFRGASFYFTYFFSLSVILIFCTLHSVVFLYDMDRNLYSSKIRLSIDRFQLLLSSSTAVMSIVFTFLARKQARQVLEDLDTVDSLMKIEAQVIHDRRQYLFGSFCRLSLVIVGIVMEHLFVTTSYNIDSLFLFVSLFFPFIIALLIEYQHNAILTSVEKRFCCLVDMLISLKGMHLAVNKQSELEMMVKVHNRLVEISCIVNDIYGKLILFIVGDIFLVTTTCLDLVVEGLIGMMLGNSYSEPEVLFTWGYWAVFRFVELWSVIGVCEAVVAKAKEFSSSLYQLMIEDTSETCKNKKIRLHLTVQREPNFSAHGFFPLDFSLLHSMIAAATTYIVILIQFSQTSNSSPGPVLLNATETERPVLSLFGDMGYSNDTI